MTALLKMLAVPALALAMVAAPAAGEARAKDLGHGYAMATIENPTDEVLHYSIQWGDGSWKAYTLYPGEYRIHHYSYPTPERVSPTLRVRFDHTMCDSEYVARQYVLTKYAGSVVSRDLSKRYVFRLSPGGCDLDLVSVN
jgi:hypothetical protein